ncbi:GIY-YIG nuclease family protein [Streptomyces sp. NPDC008092]|uniref:GIY-YIG nuclease family protein n=1 Tax=Streptomyces sp. NPDC008092 TaxID=3364808 RepID=UPI0036EDE279
MPVALCNAHRIEVALTVVPDMLRSGLAAAQASSNKAVGARNDLVTAATATPIEGLLRGEHEGVVYFISNGGRVKIGHTTNLKSRVSALSLRTDSVLLALPGGPDLERALHARFAAHRHGDTEWFDFASEIFHFASARNAAISGVTPLPSVQAGTGPSAAAIARRETRKARAFRVYADLGQPSQRAFIKVWRERGFGESDQTLRDLYNEMHEAFEKARRGTTD